jgi:hypothetical protein
MFFGFFKLKPNLSQFETTRVKPKNKKENLTKILNLKNVSEKKRTVLRIYARTAVIIY